jgi:hypothetical protein
MRFAALERTHWLRDSILVRLEGGHTPSLTGACGAAPEYDDTTRGIEGLCLRSSLLDLFIGCELPHDPSVLVSRRLGIRPLDRWERLLRLYAFSEDNASYLAGAALSLTQIGESESTASQAERESIAPYDAIVVAEDVGRKTQVDRNGQVASEEPVRFECKYCYRAQAGGVDQEEANAIGISRQADGSAPPSHIDLARDCLDSRPLTVAQVARPEIRVRRTCWRARLGGLDWAEAESLPVSLFPLRLGVSRW